MNQAKGSGSCSGQAFGRPYNPLTDRYCTECGVVIYNQGIRKLARCPNKLCGKSLRFQSAHVTPDLANSSMRVCEQCAAYIHREDSFCGVCKCANIDAISRKRRRAEAEAQKEKVTRNITIRELQMALKKERAEHKKLKEEMKNQDEVHMNGITEAMLLDDDEEAFLKSPAAENPQEEAKELGDDKKEKSENPKKEAYVNIHLRNGAQELTGSKLYVAVEGEILKTFQAEIGSGVRVQIEVIDAKVEEIRTTFLENELLANELPMLNGRADEHIANLRRRYYELRAERMHRRNLLLHRRFQPAGDGPAGRRGRVNNPRDGADVANNPARQPNDEVRIEQEIIVHTDDDNETKSSGMMTINNSPSVLGGAFCEDYLKFPKVWQKYFSLETYSYILKKYKFVCQLNIIIGMQDTFLLPKQPLAVNKRILEEQLANDAVIIAGSGKAIKCHKAFLIAHSPVFKATLAGKFAEANSNTLNLEEMSEEGVDALLAYLYYWDLGKVKQSFSLVLELLEVAHKYDIPALETAMAEIVKEKPAGGFLIGQALRLFLFARNVDAMSAYKTKAVAALKIKSAELHTTEEYKNLFLENPQAAMDLCTSLALI